MIKILIVDDDALVCKHLKKYFGEKLGHIVFTVTNPLEALDVAEKEAPHVVLLDVFMPQLNGLDLLKQIKDKYGNTVKVIMITVAGDKDHQKAKNLGADDFIHKPFDSSYLRDVVMEKIQEVLGHRKEKVKEEDVPKILIVDDETETTEEIKYFLNRIIECRVDTACNGEEGFILIKDNEYDLVFLDIKMPGISGLDLMKKIKAVKGLPDILVVTGYEDGDIAERVEKEGAIGYIPKPIYLDNFKKTIQKILRTKNKYIEKAS